MLQLLVFITIFLTGLAVGSFLNCVIYRMAPRQNFCGGLGGRSFCPHCKHQLPCQDLIPVFSFLILRGKCRYCRQKISLQYPLVELATGLLFIFVTTYNFQLTTYNLLNTCFLLFVSCFLIVIFVYDLKHYIIPDKVIYPAIVIALIYNFLRSDLLGRSDLLLSLLLSAFGAATFFLAIVLVSRGKWMGMGDIKLAFLMGLILSWPNILVALFLAFFLGAIMGIGLIIAGKKTFKSEVPFGPFLVSGTFLAMFWGQNLIDWYLNILTI